MKELLNTLLHCCLITTASINGLETEQTNKTACPFEAISFRPHRHFPLCHCLVLERKQCEENLEVVVCMQKSDHDVFLANETHLCWGQALEQTPFKLCNAQPQFLWYGLRSISMSCNEILPSKTHRSIIRHAPVAILLVMWLTFLKLIYMHHHIGCVGLDEEIKSRKLNLYLLFP